MAPGRFLRAAGDCQGEERLVKEGVDTASSTVLFRDGWWVCVSHN